MGDITTPYQKRSYTSIKAAAEKDRDGSTKTQCTALVAMLQDRGALGVTLFEAAEYLTGKLQTDIPSSTASGRLNDLMSDDKCQKYFGCPALVQKGTLRRVNPNSGKTGQAYILKSFADKPATPRGGGSAETASSGDGLCTSGPRAPAAAPVITGVDMGRTPDKTVVSLVENGKVIASKTPEPGEDPTAWQREVFEESAGRRVAKMGGRQQGKSEAMRLIRERQLDLFNKPQGAS